MKLRPHCHTAVFAAPTFVAVGTVAQGTQTANPALPAGQQLNDILIFIAGSAIAPISSGPTGYTQFEAETGGTGELRIYWKRSIGGGEASQVVSISPSSTGVMARMLAFRGCVLSGSPIDQTISSFAAAGTSLTFPVITSTRPQTMVVNACQASQSTSTGTAEFSAWLNANLQSITEIIDNTNTIGNGVGLGAAYGVLPTIASSGATTATAATSLGHAFATFNLIGTAT
jgi:hypothetical protein